MLLSVAEENYIKSLYHLQEGDAPVSTNALAAELKMRAASVTDMLKKLNSKQLLSYEPYYGARLNAEGIKVALGIVRKHRLWEYFLVDTLQFGWDEVHEVAEELEHIRSTKLIEKLDAFLGYPRFDPHGDPIPDSQGRIQVRPLVPLSTIPAGSKVCVSAVGSQSSELLELLQHKGLVLGTWVIVQRVFVFDGSLELLLCSCGDCTTISRELAEVLYVKED
jgi:DtxR family Mn-dependent transcriptional regulator